MSRGKKQSSNAKENPNGANRDRLGQTPDDQPNGTSRRPWRETVKRLAHGSVEQHFVKSGQLNDLDPRESLCMVRHSQFVKLKQVHGAGLAPEEEGKSVAMSGRAQNAARAGIDAESSTKSVHGAKPRNTDSLGMSKWANEVNRLNRLMVSRALGVDKTGLRQK